MIKTPVWFESSKPMTLGVGLSLNERSLEGDTPHFADLVEQVQAARDAGADVVWFADHFVFVNDDTGEVTGAWDVFSMIAGLAAAVPDIQLGVLVSCTGYRNPGVIAKITEAIDDISGGRFILGLGAGWNRPEYDGFGMPFDHRVSRFEESIEIIHGLLRDGTADVQGTYFQANKAVNIPRGPRASGAPILVGSSGDRMVGILARYADAWDGVRGSDPDQWREQLAKVDRACEEIGRDPKSLLRTASLSYAPHGGGEDGAIESESALIDRLTAFRELGIVHTVMWLTPRTGDEIRALASLIDQFE